MGRVFKVRDRRTGEHLALKILRHAKEGDQDRLIAEVRALAGVRHENVVRIADVGLAGGELFLTMELLEGAALDEFLPLGPHGAHEIQWLLEVAVQILSGLAALHARGIIHGDLKPSNVMVVPAGAAGQPGAANARALLGDSSVRVKLLDLGLSRQRRSKSTPTGEVTGTLLYLASEQALGASTERSDLYSLGALLYHLVCGVPPHATLTQVLSRRAEPVPAAERNPACPVPVSAWLSELLQREPAQRPRSAEEARDQLLEILRGSDRPALAPRLLAPVFVGRTSEIDRLREFFARVAGGEGAWIRVCGERGAGKTWLLRESGVACECLVEHGLQPMRIAFHRTSAVHQGLRSLIEELVAVIESRQSGAAARGLLESCGAAALAVVGATEEPAPEAWEDPGPAAAKLSRDRLADGVAGILRQAASLQPLALFLEDVHRCDDLELEVIARMVRALPGLRVGVVLSHRSDSALPAAFSKWLGDLPACSVSGSIELAGWTDGDARALLDAMLVPRGSVDEELVRLLASKSGGNPLEWTRWLQVLWARRQIAIENGEWSVQSLRGAEADAAHDAQNALVDSLGPAPLALLRAAQAVGSPAGASRLQEIAGLEGDATEREQDLVALARAGLLVEDADGYAAAPDVEDSTPAAEHAARRIGESAERALQLRAARALASSGSERTLLRAAQHFAQAKEDGEALRCYLAAGRYLSRCFANGLALDAYSKALALCSESTGQNVRPAVLEELGDLLARVGDYPGALQRLREALSARPESSRLLEKVGRVLHRQGEFDAALESFSRSLDRAGTDAAARGSALLRLGGLHLDRGDAGSARLHLEESLLIFESLGDEKKVLSVQFTLGAAEKAQNLIDAAVQRFQAALRSAEKTGSLLEAATILSNLANLHRGSGDDAMALECIQRSIALRERLGDRQGLAISHNNLARIQLQQGETEASLDATDAALRIFREIGDKKGVLIAQANRGDALRHRGRLREARSELEAALEASERLAVGRLKASILLNLAAVDVDAAEHADALVRLKECLRLLPDDKLQEVRIQALAYFAAASLRIGEIEGAGDALHEATESARDLAAGEGAGLLASQWVRYRLERGEPERAVEEAKRWSQPTQRLDASSRALLHLEAGRAYRELGPDWADRTEKELGGAVEAFEIMGSRHHAAAARAEFAIYWHLLDEDDTAAELYQAARKTFLELGLSRRIDEYSRLEALFS